MGKSRDYFKKIRDTKGTFHAKMGTVKDREVWHAAVYGVTKSRTRLSNCTELYNVTNVCQQFFRHSVYEI